MITIRHETPFDIAAREALLDGAFGDCRFAKDGERLREDRRPEAGFCRLCGRSRDRTPCALDIAAGRGRPALLLGPAAVAPDFRDAASGAT